MLVALKYNSYAYSVYYYRISGKLTGTNVNLINLTQRVWLAYKYADRLTAVDIHQGVQLNDLQQLIGKELYIVRAIHSIPIIIAAFYYG